MTQGLLELGQIMMAAAQRRLEMVSQNVSNVSTPGFKARTRFQDAITNAAPDVHSTEITDFDQGGLQQTGRNFDFAISGPGFFVLRGEDGLYYTRDGQFDRTADGRIVTARGLALQSSEGGDLVINNSAAEILPDGAVLEDGVPVARVAIVEAGDMRQMQTLGGSLFTSPEDNIGAAVRSTLRRGMLEASNVDAPAEMLQMMGAMRQAEAGARVVQAYDSLVGQAISTFGRTSR